MSKIVNLVTNIPISTMKELSKIQKELFGKKKTKNKTYFFI